MNLIKRSILKLSGMLEITEKIFCIERTPPHADLVEECRQKAIDGGYLSTFPRDRHYVSMYRFEGVYKGIARFKHIDNRVVINVPI